MKISKKNINNNLNNNKILILGAIVLILIIGYITIPTLARLKNRTSLHSVNVWDGTTADSFKGTGTLEDPYIISNGSELAYLSSQLNTTNYEGKYFVLKNDIVLNDGVFSYDKDSGIKYTKNNIENIATPNSENNNINIFKSLNGFKGNFDGNSFSIYGLYIDEPTGEQNGLFTNLEGNVSNLYVENSIIYGGKIVGGIASKASNATLNNILYNGYVVSDEELKTDVVKLELDDINEIVSNNEINNNIEINNLNYIIGNITEITLSGTYHQSDDLNAILKINNENISDGDFKINLGTKLNNEINYLYQSTQNLNLTNLKYEVTYSYSNAAGIVSITENTNLNNVINKANINAGVYASGIVNTINGDTTLKNSYNNGKITSAYASSGIISNINQNTENTLITNCYNNGELISDNSAMIGNLENNIGNISIENTFNTQDNYAINLIETSNVLIENSYVVYEKYIRTGISEGDFTKTTTDNLKTKSFITTDLKYEEFESLENPEDKVWILENNSLPILYIDDLNNPIANIKIEQYKWNNYGYELNTLKMTDKFTFYIEALDELNTITDVYYYVSDKEEELNNITTWNLYDKPVEINEEGFYVIYAKIEDVNGNITYLNTDLLLLDLTGAEITLSSSLDNTIWNEFTTNLNNYYINEEINIEINAEDELSGINKIYYYLSDKELTKEEIDNLESWNEYTDIIPITSEKTVVYVKVIDNSDYATYANSDLIILNGYSLNSVGYGMNDNTSEEINITEKSSVNFNFTYQDTNNYLEDHKHQLISNKKLPENTKITLIDKINSRVYQYITTNDNYGYDNCNDNNCEAVYDFELFNETGSENKFKESSYTGIINEEFNIILDFQETEINENIENISISLKLNNNNSKEQRKTLSKTKKTFNIISNDSHAYFTLTSSFDDTINYNENAKYVIDFESKLNYKYINDKKIFDTTYDDKYIGLSIKMIDSNGNIVDKKYLKNIMFSIGEKNYSPSSDNLVRINLEQETKDINDNLIIETFSDNSNLKNGGYKFIIESFIAYDGEYTKEVLDSIEIPVYVGLTKYNTVNSSFNVTMNSEDKIIKTNSNEFNFNFEISDLQTDTYIKFSLYKKNELSAYDQNYTQIDINDYLIDNTFEKFEDKVYYVSNITSNNYNLDLNLNTKELEKNGYMFVFELYNDEKLISKINKKFIVK